MKVASMRGSGFTAAATAVTGIVVVAAMLAGSGFVPSRAALAQVEAADAGERVLEVLELPPAPGLKSADSIREPSGLGAADAARAGRRKPTALRPATPRTVTGTPAPPQATDSDGWKSAKASWYGPGFYGNTMAGGGTLQPDSMVVAHKSMSFGTMIEV